MNKQDWLSQRLNEEDKSVQLDASQLEKAYQQEKALQGALSKLGNKPVPKHSMQLMLSKAKWRNRVKSWLPSTIAYGAGLSTAFAVMMVLNLSSQQQAPLAMPEQMVSLKQVVHYANSLQDQKVLNTMVALESKQDVPWAMVTIHLPEGVELDGFPGLRTVQYDTALFKGQNHLPMTLIRNNGLLAGEVEVEIDADQSPQLFSVPLEVAHRSDVY